MTIQRPRRLSGFGDNSAAFDWSQYSTPIIPSTPIFSPADAGAPSGSGSMLDQIVSGAQQYYQGVASINQAQAAAQLAKAQGDAAVAKARAGGAYGAQQAGGAGALPSPSLLLVAGLALGAIFLLKSK